MGNTIHAETLDDKLWQDR